MPGTPRSRSKRTPSSLRSAIFLTMLRRERAASPTTKNGSRAMDLRFNAEEQAFRDEVRGFIRDNLPADIAERLRQGLPPRKTDTIAWQRLLNRRHWAAYSWPAE